MTPLVIDLPYRPDSAPLFSALVERPWPVFLDSGRPGCAQGRYDILSADPRTVLVTRGQRTEVRTGRAVRASLVDPFALLQEALGPRRPGVPDLPFSGGAIGWFAYDLARRLERLPSLAQDAEGTPDLAVGIYDWALVVDHEARRTRLVAQDSATLAEYQGVFAAALAGRRMARPRAPFRVLDRVRPNLSHAQYLEAVARIKHYLLEGDCYQVNLAQRFAAPTQGDPWEAYQDLRVRNPAPFSAYLATPDCQVLCSSPERFLQVRGDRCRPSPSRAPGRAGPIRSRTCCSRRPCKPAPRTGPRTS